MQHVTSKILKFCEGCSVKGIAKIATTDLIQLRFLWILFTVGMAVLLSYNTRLIVKEYLEYDTYVQSEKKQNASSPFPAISFCDHNGFGKNSSHHWSSKDIISPKEYNTKLRNMIHSHLESDNHSQLLLQTIQTLLHFDKRQYYYQNIDFDDVRRLSHTDGDVIKYCVTTINNTFVIGSIADCNFTITKFYHPKYMACFSVQPSPADTLVTEEITLILQLDNQPKNNHVEDAFLYDVFDRASGIRMSVHEPGVYTDIDRDGMQLQPGKLIEVKYTPIKNVEVNTPVEPCDDKPAVKYRDMDTIYNYSVSACVLSEIGNMVANKCKCHRSMYFSEVYPNVSVPFCGNLMVNLWPLNFSKTEETAGQRWQCFQRINFDHVLTKLRKSVCLPRCISYDYKLSTSTTRWDAPSWQVQAVVQQQLEWNQLRQGANHGDAANHYRSMLLEYVNAANIAAIRHEHKSITEGKYIFVRVKRNDNGLLMRHEKLKVTPATLFSKIGGLCSLYMGLTCVFLGELFDQGLHYLVKLVLRRTN